MAYQHKPNTGSLFANDKREKDSQPNAKGSGLIDCPHCKASYEVWLAAWTNTSSRGPYQSIKIEAKDDQPQSQQPYNQQPQAPQQQAPSPYQQARDGDIPF